VVFEFGSQVLNRGVPKGMLLIIENLFDQQM